jgi:hypothetical protein
MTTLKELIAQEKAAESFGKLIVLYQIRTYIQQQSHQSILKEISEVWEEEDLKILLGAGMPGELYYAAMGQGARIKGLV